MHNHVAKWHWRRDVIGYDRSELRDLDSLCLNRIQKPIVSDDVGRSNALTYVELPRSTNVAVRRVECRILFSLAKPRATISASKKPRNPSAEKLYIYLRRCAFQICVMLTSTMSKDYQHFSGKRRSKNR